MATATSSYLNRSTPGVYITEIDAFGTGIVGVATAVPIFVGYTQFAGDPVTGASLYNTPVAISSFTEFTNYFGGAAPQGFTVSLPTPAPTPPSGESGGAAVQPTPSFTAYYTPGVSGSAPPESGSGGATAALQGFMLNPVPDEPQFTLYWQMRLFFANGGGNCYVVSCGSYWSDELPTSPPDTTGWMPGAIVAGDLVAGLAQAAYAVGPTMIVVPEACQLNQADYGTVAITMLAQASTLQDRVAILDLPGCLGASTIDALTDCQNNLWDAIAPQIASASYGAAYAPALSSSIVTTSDILYTNLQSSDNTLINNILTTQAYQIYGSSPAQFATIQAAIASAFPLEGPNAGANSTTLSGNGSAYPAQTATQTALQWQTSLDNMLQNSLPIFKQVEQQIANTMNVMAPSGALAGVWTKSDAQSGVWNAPANIALASVTAPLYNMSDVEQGGFNVPTNGQAIDVIRAQPSRGTVVWGARTLDGNSLDYRYIQVRRTLIYVEQSIKLALQTFVFAPNDATTWSTVNAAISSFLAGLWQSGGLMGAKSSDAFTVSVGLGSTMTSQDILNGYMIVAVTLQMIHPAEFIELTFTQTMGS
jgi:hypothetical protein